MRKHCPVGAWTAHFGAANIHIGRGNVCNIIVSSGTCACLASAQGQEIDCLSDAWFLCLCARSLSASRRSAAQFLCGRPYATTWTSLLSRPHEFGDFAIVTLPRMRGASLAHGMLRLVYRDQMPEKHIVVRNADGGVVRFADAVLTAFDLVHHADLVGGMSSVATVLAELLESVDFAASSDLGAFVPCVVWQRLGYICENVIGNTEKADALYAVWRSLGLRAVNTSLSPFEQRRDGELNRRWHVKVNLDLEVDDL